MSGFTKLRKALSLDNEIAVVTGGGSGLGFAIAKALSTCRARVFITGRTKLTLQRAAQAIGDRAQYLVHDVCDTAATSELFRQIAELAGPVTILVNNAGVHLKKEALDTTPREFQTVLSTHVIGSFSMSIAAVPYMQQVGHGSILFMASMTSLIGMPKVIAYTAAKSAYLGMVRSLANELSATGIRVNAIAPGWIETPMLRRALEDDPQRRDRILTRTPMHKFGQPEDVANAAVFLCSSAAKYITGVILPVDGGASIGF